jgi:mannose-6-phosphate isomerase-like protein (cupin superfamily)
MPNHFHANVEESFFVFEGEATLWMNCTEKFTIKVGDLYRDEPGEMHYFVNETDEPFEALFIKAPYDPTDTIQVPWTPGEPVPTTT